MIDNKKLIEDLIPILNENDDMFLAGRIIGTIDKQPQVGGWIPVSERLPDNGYEVLVTVNGKHNNITFINALEIAEYNSEDGWILEGYLDWTNPDVTAWQTLPEPYKESEEE